MTCTLAVFGALDWSILAGYLGIVAAVGYLASRGQCDAQSYFLAGRSMPAWAVTLSVLATSLSAATFIGAPQITYTGDLTYLMLNLGGVLAAVFVALVFLPRLYHAGTLTIYGYLGRRFGPASAFAASLVFLLGRLLASGARLFMAGLAFSLILFDSPDRQTALIGSILVVGVVGTAYTAMGGIKAVIWTDTLQIIMVLGAAIGCVFLLLHAIPLDFAGLLDALRHAPGGDKLRVFDSGMGGPHGLAWGKPYTLAAALAVTLANAAAYGVDQDLAQRLMTTRSPMKAGASLVGSILLSIPVVGLFLVIGLLLSIYYGRPELMGAAVPRDTLVASAKVYPRFLVHHLPTGLAGLAMAGMLAAAMSSLDSAINAMAGSIVADLIEPWKKMRASGEDDPDSARASPRSLTQSRGAVVAMGALLCVFAIGASIFQSLTGQTLIDFALGVMAFAYAGLLGVFLTALLTRRGNTASVIAALIGGFVTILLVQPYMLPAWCGFALAWPYWMVAGTAVSFTLCVVGRPQGAIGAA